MAANKYLCRQNVVYNTMFVHNYMNTPQTGVLKICLTLLTLSKVPTSGCRHVKVLEPPLPTQL
jgi:hypothetical protein